MQKGMMQIYKGDGKGKTTAAVGQVVRALGYNMKIFWVSFFKDPKKWGSGEIKMLEALGVGTRNFVCEHPWFGKKTKKTCVRSQCIEALKFIQKLFKKNFDLIVLDEINDAVRAGFMKEEEILLLLKNKPKGTEIILTGRNVTDAIIKKADLVTEMKMIKHPFTKGIKARKGIEY